MADWDSEAWEAKNLPDQEPKKNTKSEKKGTLDKVVDAISKAADNYRPKPPEDRKNDAKLERLKDARNAYGPGAYQADIGDE